LQCFKCKTETTRYRIFLKVVTTSGEATVVMTPFVYCNSCNPRKVLDTVTWEFWSKLEKECAEEGREVDIEASTYMLMRMH
jgi:hypothetical protein